MQKQYLEQCQRWPCNTCSFHQNTHSLQWNDDSSGKQWEQSQLWQTDEKLWFHECALLLKNPALFSNHCKILIVEHCFKKYSLQMFSEGSNFPTSQWTSRWITCICYYLWWKWKAKYLRDIYTNRILKKSCFHSSYLGFHLLKCGHGQPYSDLLWTYLNTTGVKL